MKVPCTNNIVSSLISPWDPHSDTSRVMHTENTDTAFTSILDTSLTSGIAIGSEPSMSERMKLLRLVEIVQIQMYKALLKSTSETDEDDVEAALPGWLPGASTGRTMTGTASNSTQVCSRPVTETCPGGLNPIIQEAARTYDVDPALISSVIRAESGFDPNATSPRGAMGLMQLMPDTARDLGVKNPYDPQENVMAGTRYLKSLLTRYGGDVSQTLAAYNWGMGNVERHPDELPRETREYIARITQYLNEAVV